MKFVWITAVEGELRVFSTEEKAQEHCNWVTAHYHIPVRINKIGVDTFRKGDK